jgi:hypothetical protein
MDPYHFFMQSFGGMQGKKVVWGKSNASGAKKLYD